MIGKRVRFSEITIREYPMELGDHPSCSHGAPVQIGWEPQSVSKRDLDLYEFVRGETRNRKELAIPVQRRAQLLFAAGYTLEQIGDATMEVLTTKKLRRKTKMNQGWDRANLLLETTGKLPRDIVNSFASLVIKPKQRIVHARSA